jgi:hypothetical protein
MYFQANDHKAIAEKKIGFFMDQIRTKYFLTSDMGDVFVEQLAKKTGNDLVRSQHLFALIKVIQTTQSLTKEMLLDLNKQLEEFKL